MSDSAVTMHHVIFAEPKLCRGSGSVEKHHHNEDEGKRPIIADPPVVPLQHVVTLLGVVILRPPALPLTARPECVHLDIFLQEFNIVFSENEGILLGLGK